MAPPQQPANCVYVSRSLVIPGVFFFSRLLFSAAAKAPQDRSRCTIKDQLSASRQQTRAGTQRLIPSSCVLTLCAYKQSTRRVCGKCSWCESADARCFIKICIRATMWTPKTHVRAQTSSSIQTTLSQGNFQFPNTCKHAVLPQPLWSSNRPELCPGGHRSQRWLGCVCFLFYRNAGK